MKDIGAERERLSELATTEIGFDPILSPGKKTENKGALVARGF